MARPAELDGPDVLMEDDERAASTTPIRAALADVDRRLAIAPVAQGGT